MLRDLHLRNLAVLAEASIELGPGLTVLTGETGAGKSIVVDALSLLAGGRARADLIRTGADSLSVSGIFEPPDDAWREQLRAVGLDAPDPTSADGDLLIIRREVSRNGRNRAFVNDQPATLKLLCALTAPLLRIHGQREELGLVTPDLQRAWLDRSGGKRAATLQRQTAAAFDHYRALDEQLQALTTDRRGREEKIDFLRFQLAEIEDAGLEAGEDEQLRRQRNVLQHAEAIQDALTRTVDRLDARDGAAYDLLEESRRTLADVASWLPEAVDWSAELEELRIRVGELTAAVQARLDQTEHSPGQLDAVEGRLAQVERLLAKHGENVVAVLARRDELAAELAGLEGDESGHDQLRADVAAALESFRAAAVALSRARASWAPRMAKATLAECRDLALDKARFEVALAPRRLDASPLIQDGEAIAFGPHGIDHVTFRFSPNPGEDLQSLAKAASGGELSRLYLAVQLAARGRGKAQNAAMVFDEVDAGIGGAEAASLGEKLKRLAAGGQILAVTHLPQVASFADYHFKVEKQVQAGRTHTAVRPLDEAARTDEIARMLAGAEVTELSLSHARELIAGTAG